MIRSPVDIRQGREILEDLSFLIYLYLTVTVPDTEEPRVIRDRAILEVFYSTGMRRGELTNLSIYDIDYKRGLLLIRSGKGNKDRMIPIGERALL